MASAREEVDNLREEERITAVLTSNVPPSAEYTLKIRDRVLTYSKEQAKWVQGFGILDMQHKKVWANDRKRIFELHISQVLPEIIDNDEQDVT